MTISVSIIIPVSRLDVVQACLESLDAQTFSREEFEVVLVSASNIGALESLKTEFPLTLIEDHRNHPSILRNLGVAAAKGHILGFLDDDTVIPENWVEDVANLLTENPDRIIGGPNVDRRPELRFALANAIQEHPLLEGLRNHGTDVAEEEQVNAHNLPLSNAAMTRNTFEKIGGFNEIANYYMDGSEFLYIAKRLDVPIYLYRRLTIQHDNRPVPFQYFKYKFRSRWMVGKNFVLFPECYRESFQIRIVFASFLVIPLLAAVLWHAGVFVQSAVIGLIVYLAVLYLLAAKNISRPLLFLTLAPGVILAQAAMYAGFLCGLIYGAATRTRNAHVLDHKLERYKAFEDRA